MDQTKEFIEQDHDIVFLGNLFLKGKPYTNPKEAVDKEYVDTAFDNITTENLKGSKIEDKNFPAFNGDLINKAGQNNFLLKETGIKAGMYHKLSFDKAGRVIGGTPGKLTLKPGDFGGISYDKIDYSKTPGKGESIYDYTKDFDSSQYLMINKPNIIDKPLKINTKEIKEGHTVLHEGQLMTVSERYFRGRIDEKKNDLAGRGLFGKKLDIYNNIGGTADRFQRNFNYGKITLQDYKVELTRGDDSNEVVNKIISRNIRVKHIYYKGSIYLMDFYDDGTQENLDNEILKLNFNSEGEFTDYETITAKKIKLSKANMDDVFVINNFIVVVCLVFDPNRRWKISYIDIESLLNGGEWLEAVGSRVSSFGLMVLGKNLYLNRGDSGTCVSYRLTESTERIRISHFKSLPGAMNRTRADWEERSFNSFTIGPNLYYFYTNTNVNVSPMTNYYPVEFYRMSYNDFVPFGVWENVHMDVRAPYGFSNVIVLRDNVYVITLGHNNDPLYKGKIVLSSFDIDETGLIYNYKIVEVIDKPSGMGSGYFKVFLIKNRFYIVSTTNIVSFKAETKNYIPYDANDLDFELLY